jgi:hypothetical protein
MKHLPSLTLVSLTLALLGTPSFAANDSVVKGNAPVAKKANDQRTLHLRRRDACEKQAGDQGLQAEDFKVFVQRCLQG